MRQTLVDFLIIKTYLVINLELSKDSCGTEMAQENDLILFTNTVKVLDRQHPFGIQLADNDAKIPVTCQFHELLEIKTQTNVTKRQDKVEGFW